MLYKQSVSQPFPPTALQCIHTQTVRDSTSSYEIDYVIVIKNFLNLEGHENPIGGSKVTAILLRRRLVFFDGGTSLHGNFLLLPSLLYLLPVEAATTAAVSMN